MAIENTDGAAPKKEKKNIYTGIAEIVGVEMLEPKYTKKMSEEEVATAFDIGLSVRPADSSIGDQTVNLSVSSRVNPYTNKTDAAMTIDTLTKHGLIENGDISTVFNAVGKKCNIELSDEISAKGVYRTCRLSFARVKISGADMARRLQALGASMKKPANATEQAPAQSQKVNENPFA